MRQLTLDLPDIETEFIPSTRYQGSKAKVVQWIWEHIQELPFDTVLDAFGGTGVVGYWLKQKGKQVTYNDILRFNYLIGLALIENNTVHLDTEDIETLLFRHPGLEYSTFIADTFGDIYYTDEENQWLDLVVQNIALLTDPYKRALAYYALFQACLVKRPFNLFHRKNLYLRFADVERSFGNKTTWDTSFEAHFRSFVSEVNSLVVDNGRANRALNEDVWDIEGDYDLVYVDPPYISQRGVGVDYHHFYHFLEGLARYEEWPALVNYRSKHRRMRRVPNPWVDAGAIHDAFARLLDRFNSAILAVSYRADGIPSIDDLEEMIRQVKRHVRVHTLDGYQYVLSTRRTAEVLIVGV
ncbi:MAG: DNA methyltransferase [Chloroflexi bacterium]|nr:MAG: DNA methyltransferase [Chloroflexota bacterium]